MSIWSKKRHFKFIRFYLMIVSLLTCFVLGYLTGHNQKNISTLSQVSLNGARQECFSGSVKNKDSIKQSLLKEVDFNIFWTVWRILQHNYVDVPINEPQLFYGAVKGMVASVGDPYTTFLDPETYEAFTKDFEGTFEGIGAEIGYIKEHLAIIAPLADSPAEKAGLQNGDFILKIDDRDTLGMSLDVAVKLIRGERGTPVKLTVLRENLEEPLEISIIRDTINVESVKWEIQENTGIGVISISHFNDDTLPLLREAAREMKSRSINKLILDLRNNPGGYLITAIDVASYWIDKDPILIERFNDGRERQYKGKGTPDFRDVETVVLVNRGSASAAEIVAGALQDYGMAKVVGVKTFGKGSVQMLEELKDGSALKLTIAKWLTPHRRSIDEEGIQPDVVIGYNREDFEEGRDPQKDKAIELLTVND